MTKGYVYILTNEAMPGLVKIGKTTRDPASRAVELHQTGVPFPFVVAASVIAPDCHDLERLVHATMHDCRVRHDREFFRCDVETARTVLENCHYEHVELWLDEYLPDHMPVRSEFVIDEGLIEHLAAGFDPNLIEMADALGCLTPDDVAGAVDRWRSYQDARLARINANGRASEGEVIQ